MCNDSEISNYSQCDGISFQNNFWNEGKKKERESWVFWFYGISTFVGYLMPIYFYTNNQFYFKQSSLAWVHSLIVKNTSISSYSVYLNSYNSANSV